MDMTTGRSFQISATLPWRSPDAGCLRKVTRTEQSSIDRCLSCGYDASLCDLCDGRGHIRQRGYKYDPDLLREVLRLRVCRAEAARRLGISRQTLYNYLARLEKEADG